MYTPWTVTFHRWWSQSSQTPHKATVRQSSCEVNEANDDVAGVSSQCWEYMLIVRGLSSAAAYTSDV